jgi:hypothetical protein
MKDTITFETITQAAIFDLEFKGQISDGHWENDASSNYETWCDADVEVSGNGLSLGRNFYVSKNLGFGSKKLFDIVGDRMCHYGRMALIAERLFPESSTADKITLASMLEDCIWTGTDSGGDDKPEWKGLPKWKRKAIAEDSDFAKKYVIPNWNKLMEVGVIRILEEACDAFVDFTEEDARKDTLRISKIAKLEN